MAYEVTLIPGDGAGPELAEAAKRCVNAVGVFMLREIQAVSSVSAQGSYITYDMKPHRDDAAAVGTREMADATCPRLQ